MSDKRIIDLEAKQTIGSGDYLAADSAQGTYKVDADTNIMTPLTNVRNNVANGSASPDKYSSSTAYKVGDMVIHDDILYICTTACSAASWAVNSACFTATTLASAITQLNSELTDVTNTSFNTKMSVAKRNHRVFGYGELTGLSSGNLITFGTMPIGYRPNAYYYVSPLFSHAEPYNPIGTIWISNSDGSIVIYKPSSTTSGYYYFDYEVS